MKALREIRTISEKTKFLESLTKMPCTEGKGAFLKFKGSVEEYFIKHERGAKALVWCLDKGFNIDLLTDELCLVAAKQCGLSVYYLTEEQRKPNVCLAAVQENGLVVHLLTDKHRKPEVCIAAVKQNGCAVKYLTDKQRTRKVCLAAVKQSIFALEYLTEEQRKYVEGI